jgi:GTPase SAR1 family protein
MNLNCLLLGDELVGKTTISRNFSNTFIKKHEYSPTKGLDVYEKKLTSAAISLYDVSGSDFPASLLRDTNIIILVYDVQNYASFLSLSKWMQRINRVFFKLDTNSPPLPLTTRLPLIAIFGNKTDLGGSSVPHGEINRFAEEIRASVYYVCAYSGSGINEAFTYIVANFTVVDKGSVINAKQRGGITVEL